jgi:hypothetical protein
MPRGGARPGPRVRGDAAEGAVAPRAFRGAAAATPPAEGISNAEIGPARELLGSQPTTRRAPSLSERARGSDRAASIAGQTQDLLEVLIGRGTGGDRTRPQRPRRVLQRLGRTNGQVDAQVADALLGSLAVPVHAMIRMNEHSDAYLSTVTAHGQSGGQLKCV